MYLASFTSDATVAAHSLLFECFALARSHRDVPSDICLCIRAFFNALVTRIAVQQGVGLGDVTDMTGGATHGSSRKKAAPKAAFFY